MPRGTPFRVCASVVLLSRRSGLTKLRLTRLTDGRPSPRSISQWLLTSKSVMLRTLPHRHASLEQCQVPYTCGGVGVAETDARAGAATEPSNTMAVSRIRMRRTAAPPRNRKQPELIVDDRLGAGNRTSVLGSVRSPAISLNSVARRRWMDEDRGRGR